MGKRYIELRVDKRYICLHHYCSYFSYALSNDDSTRLTQLRYSINTNNFIMFFYPDVVRFNYGYIYCFNISSKRSPPSVLIGVEEEDEWKPSFGRRASYCSLFSDGFLQVQ